MDFIAIASMGFYPTPTPTNKARAAFVATYGLINIDTGTLPSSNIMRGLGQLGMSLIIT